VRKSIGIEICQAIDLVGDLVIGDDDGVLCVPLEEVGSVFKRATAKFEAEERQMANNMDD
jgi:regulator of RNase E activity RraA